MDSSTSSNQNGKIRKPPPSKESSDYIPLSQSTPKSSNYNKNSTNKANLLNSSEQNDDSLTKPRPIFGDYKLYSRLCDVLNAKQFNDTESIVNYFQRIYPEYKRKKRVALRKSIEKGIEMINKDLNINSSDDSNESDIDFIEENDINMDKVEFNVVNNSLNNLYAKNQSSTSQTTSKTKLNLNSTSSDPIKSKKARVEQTEEQKADKTIDAALNKQAKLREKYLLKPKVTFDDFGGISDVIIELKRLLFHIRNSELYRQLGVDPPRGFLLYGPPGVGKSLLVEALANDLQIPCLRCGATEIIAGISGESEEKIRELFSLAKSLKPCLLFIDEIDAITPKRENAAREMERRIVTQLITCLDNLSDGDGSGDGVMVIGCTNRPDSLDPALRRAGRFDRELPLGIPDEKARSEILKVICRGTKLQDNFNFESLAHRTPGYVGADLKCLIREAAISALERFVGLNQIISNQISADKICLQDNRPPPAIDHCDGTENDEIKSVMKIDQLMNESSFQIEMKDFEIALKQVQPSSKREGFATVPDVSWEDIGALSSVRQELQMSILAPIRYMDDVHKLGLTLSAGIMLCGPPGCGKTLLAKAIANESGINFISVKGPELLNMYVGESERAVRAVFTRARSSKPCVIFFDEIDALCPKRTDSESSNVTSRVVNQLLTEMDGLEARNCFLLAATNRPDIVDPAILRPGRFDKVLYVGFPSADDRYEILLTITKKGTKPPIESAVDLKQIAHDERLEGFTGADMSALIREACLDALRERIDGVLAHDQDIILKKSHFSLAMDRVKPSVSKADRIDYLKMFETYS